MVLLAAGFGLSLFGSLPPGLISLSVAQTAIQRGMVAALLLAAGAAGAEFFQAWAAVALTDWFLSHPAVERWFQWAAIPVFFTLAVYLLFWSKPHQSRALVAEVSPSKQVGKGILLSAFNLLAIPYWFVYCGSLRVSGWWEDVTLGSTLLFSAGVTLGTMAALGLYAWLGQLILQHSASMARHADRFVGLIFLGLGIKLLLGLLR
ncbi:MAG TPA: LysE family transporter [Saprospiraceae bacterium]|nr:LysE family transporter [Saprospiraceae bacterium]